MHLRHIYFLGLHIIRPAISPAIVDLDRYVDTFSLGI